MFNIRSFLEFKKKQEKITLLTCYDYTTAKILNKTEVHALLVGDSVAMVMHGYPDTLSADLEMLLPHVRAVVKGAPDKFVIADMPFLSCRKSLDYALDVAGAFIKAGAAAVKIEGARGNQEVIQSFITAGIPVMGHIGLETHAVRNLGGFFCQGKTEALAEKIIQEALQLEAWGCFSLVLECVTESLAQSITQQLKIPIIGIGSGQKTDGQILVIQDVLGLNTDFKPKFVKSYFNGAPLLTEAVNAYCQEVKEGIFPQKEHSFLN